VAVKQVTQDGMPLVEVKCKVALRAIDNELKRNLPQVEKRLPEQTQKQSPSTPEVSINPSFPQYSKKKLTGMLTDDPSIKSS